MPLVSIIPELKKAQQGGYAISLFDTFDMRSTEGMFNAIEEKQAPTIIAVYSSAMDQPTARALSAYIKVRAEDASVPISVMLDHGSSVEQCLRAIEYGFTDVMYDGSTLPIEENMANTKAVVQAAHPKGIGVEAELGLVGRGENYQDIEALRSGFTDPEDAKRFVAETGVDALAVAIGTAHGVYRGDPQIDLELLQRIRVQVDVPLVLHGGSGCTEEQFRAAIKAGIAKINVATDLYLTTGKRKVKAARAEELSYFEMRSVAIDSFQERCGYYLDLFGTTGKAR